MSDNPDMQVKRRAVPHRNNRIGFTPLNERGLEFIRLLRKAIEDPANVRLSVKNKNSTSRIELHGNCQILDKTDVKSRIVLKIPSGVFQSSWDPEKFEAYAVIFASSRSLLCVESSQIEWTEKEAILHFPWRAFRYQRRKSDRYEIPTGYDYEIEMVRPNLGRAKILDLSTEGMSILLNRKNAEALPVGSSIKRLSLKIWGNSIACAADVVRKRVTQKGVRIGLKFRGISREDSETISAFVDAHLAEYSD